MPDDIALITPHFNFAGYETPRTNFRIFRESLTYPVKVVELSLTGRFHCATHPQDLRLQSDARSVMLQQSRLVNLGIRSLPDKITKVAWIDGDILIEDPQWLDKLSELLDDVQVAQPFSRAFSMDASGHKSKPRASWCQVMSGKHSQSDMWSSTRGYVWGARLDALSKLPGDTKYVGLIERQLSSEDTVMACIWSGFGPGGDTLEIGPHMAHYCHAWYKGDGRRTMGFLDGNVYHLYHGEVGNRRYQENRQFLKSVGFDPLGDLTIDPESGVFRWAKHRTECITYFFQGQLDKQEDCALPKIVTPKEVVSVPAVPKTNIGPLGTVTDLQVITCMFNPMQATRIVRNYWTFRNSLRGVPLITIELVLDDDKPAVHDAIHVRGTRKNHKLWQKERLLNRVINSLPSDVDAVAWLDADILMQNPEWLEATIETLSYYHIAQLFTDASWIGSTGDVTKTFVSAAAQSNVHLGHPGFAWAARRDFLRDIGGLYELDIFGGGDARMCWGFANCDPLENRVMFSEKMLQGWIEWHRRVSAITQGKIGVVPGSVVHLFHGEYEDRRYRERMDAPLQTGFNPATDVYVDDDGLLRLTDHNVHLGAWMKQYFRARGD